MQSTNEAVVKKAALLGDMHLRNLRQKMTLIQLMEEAAKKLEVNSSLETYLLFRSHLDKIAVVLVAMDSLVIHQSYETVCLVVSGLQ